MHHLQQKISALRTALNGCVVEREKEVDALILGLISQEHVLLISPVPGLAKSRMAEQLARSISGAKNFFRQLTKDMDRDEVFGPPKLSSFKQDIYERSVEGYAPTCHVSTFDEIFKAGPSVYNCLLRYLQERKFENGLDVLDCPLVLSVGSSNEYPSDEEAQEANALVDRFLIRLSMAPVSHRSWESLGFDEFPDVEPVISLDEVRQATQSSAKLPFSDEGKQIWIEILHALEAEGIVLGDRRIRKSVGVAKANAYIHGYDSVVPESLDCLKDVLWDQPEQAVTAAQVVLKLANPVMLKIDSIISQINDVTRDEGDLLASIAKMEDIYKQTLALDGNGRADSVREFAEYEMLKMRAKYLGADLHHVKSAYDRQKTIENRKDAIHGRPV